MEANKPCSNAPLIHPTAVIADGARLGPGTEVGPYSVIGPHVKMGAGNWIGPHAVIEGRTTIGANNRIFQFASVGAEPQDMKFHGESSRLEIGDGNIVREYVTLQPGTEGGGMLTKVGNGNLFMANSHVGHDGIIGNNNWFANSTALAGHVLVGSGCVIGGLVGIHQFVRLGDNCMLGAGSMVSKDMPPFCIGQGDRAGLIGINQIGMQRHGFAEEDIKQMKKLYRELFFGSGLMNDRLAALEKEVAEGSTGWKFLQFVISSERGITLPRKKSGADAGE